MCQKYRNKLFGFLLLMLSCSLTGCMMNPQEEISDTKSSENQETKELDKAESNVDSQYKIKDNKLLYANDDDTSVVTMYLTVRQGNAEENTNHTWQEINSHSVFYYEDQGIERAKAEAILQVGDENGPVEGELGYGVTIPNAIVNIRGQTSSKASLKSYKIELKDGKGNWREQTTINLNKHVYDETKFRNKLCYDLMEELPDMIALRTQFVHLYVKDETVEGNSGFEDYGLYTQVEQPNKTFLKNHGFDRYGQLYKINYFEFYRNEDVIKLRSDADYDEKAFNELLETKGDDDHSKLIAMLDDVNNYSMPIEEVFDKWFDESNFFGWMAFHILVGNKDTQSRNTLLYSPLNLNKWYFISWDNDDAFTKTSDEVISGDSNQGWEYGISNYWGNVLFQRVLRSPKYRTILNDKIEEYRKIITKEKLTNMIAGYEKITSYYRDQLPDILVAKVTDKKYQEICEKIPDEVELNYEDYKKSLECPMPFFILDPHEEDGKQIINWDVSYDFDNEDVTYKFELARDYTFKNPIIKEENLELPEMELGDLEPGQYFVRVTSKNESGYEQQAFDYYDVDSDKIYGVKCFYVLPDGTIQGDDYDE